MLQRQICFDLLKMVTSSSQPSEGAQTGQPGTQLRRPDLGCTLCFGKVTQLELFPLSSH